MTELTPLRKINDQLDYFGWALYKDYWLEAIDGLVEIRQIAGDIRLIAFNDAAPALHWIDCR